VLITCRPPSVELDKSARVDSKYVYTFVDVILFTICILLTGKEIAKGNATARVIEVVVTETVTGTETGTGTAKESVTKTATGTVKGTGEVVGPAPPIADGIRTARVETGTAIGTVTATVTESLGTKIGNGAEKRMEVNESRFPQRRKATTLTMHSSSKLGVSWRLWNVKPEQ
jgi:hypothetical protein